MTETAVGRSLTAVARTFGLRGASERAWFELRRATGLLRSEPKPVRLAVHSAPVPTGWPFVPDAARLRSVADRESADVRADLVLSGMHQAYRWRWQPRPRSVAEWHALERHVNGAEAPWYREPATNGGPTDIKDAWEPGRFAWAYDLARGWIVDGDDRYAEEFWHSLEVFAEACPPFRGVQWGCGQETAIRAIALLWAEGALRDSPSSTAERLGQLRTVLAWSGERIADAIGYGLSQRNNHGISEATGLIAIGARLLDADPRAESWLERGTQDLEQCVLDQFEEDGWYAQHSFNYLRVALDMLVVAQRALRCVGNRESGIGNRRGFGLSDAARDRVEAGIALLAEVTDPATGAPPLHGANDGAWVLPLSTAPYRDYRPSLTAAAVTYGVPMREALAPDEETLAWLGAAPPEEAPAAMVPRVVVGGSGWVHAVTEGARLFGRAGEYRNRPGHIDPLHLDIWVDGRAVARDAGTFRYAAPAPWRNGLAPEEVHNTLTLIGHPIAERGPRFLWLSWPRARVVEDEIRDDDTVVVRLVNESWDDIGVRHERVCELSAYGATVIDRLLVAESMRLTARLHWLIDGPADDIVLVGSPGAERRDTMADESSVLGWISEGYAYKRGARSVELTGPVVDGKFVAVTGFGADRSEDALRRRLDAELAR